MPLRTPPPRVWGPVGLAAIIGVVVSLALFALVRSREQKRVEKEFESRAQSQFSAIWAGLDRYGEALYSLRSVFVSVREVDPVGLRNVVGNLMERHEGFLAFQWAPRVMKQERERTEVSFRKNFGGDFRISDLTPDGRIVASPSRAEYFPIVLGTPSLPKDMFVGRDLASIPAFQSLLTIARTSADLAVSDPLANFAGVTDQPVIVTVLAVYNKVIEPPPAERSALLRGYLVGISLASNTLEHAFRTLPSVDIDAMFLDLTAPPPSRLVHYHAALANPATRAAVPTESEFTSGIHKAIPMTIRNQQWKLLFRPTPHWVAAQTSRTPYVVLLGGLTLTGLIAAYLGTLRRRTTEVERLVTQRTAELVTSNEKLAREITERAQAEHALRQSESSLVRAQRIGQIGSWEVDLQRQTLRWSAETFRIFGRAADEFTPTTADFLAAVHPEDLPAVRASSETARRTGERYQIEHRILRPDGSQRFVVEQAEVLRDDLGKPAKLVGTVQDITDRKLIEQALQLSEERLRLAVEGAELGTWHWEIATGRLVWSEQCYKIFGVPPGRDVTYEQFLQTLHSEERSRANQALRLALDEHKEYDIDYRIVWPDHSIHWVAAIGRGYYDASGRPLRMEGIVLDITARKQAEEERQQMERKLQETQKLESLGVLAGGVAHDFNNLLTGILGNACLARLDLPPDSPVQLFIEHIESASQRASELCKQMLAYSGKGRFVIQKIDLSTLAKETTPLLQLSTSKKAELQLDLPPGLPPVAVDATQVRQIIMNLVINASEALGENSGTIRITTGLMHADRNYLAGTHLSPELPAGEYVFLEVADTGCGMSRETLARIFDPFFTTKFTGRGLGLAAVLGIVRGHRGAMKVASAPGEGTSFRMLLPRAEGQAEDSTETLFGNTDWSGTGTVLVVDDEEPVRSVAARMLQSLGFDTVLAADGREAIVRFHESADQIVAILLDLTMPQLDGEETFRRLRVQRADARVILMSGFNEQEAVNRFAGQGLAGFLQKPFRLETLREKIQAAIH
ncbi:MAG: PAS domain-containing protein [Verrucomicrobia bacterium]|nr:PAS domain-containing protein [Verrucomicrobiota bacterium]